MFVNYYFMFIVNLQLCRVRLQASSKVCKTAQSNKYFPGEAKGGINTERHFVCFETAPAFYAAASEHIRAARDET